MYARTGWESGGDLPPRYGGTAFAEENRDGYIEGKRNPWEEAPKEPAGENPVSAFSFLRGMFPPSPGNPLGKILPLFGMKPPPPPEKHSDTENLLLLLVAVFLILCPKGDKKAALLLLLVYFLA